MKDVTEHPKTDGWIGASLLRKEDARHLNGAGMFIADMRMPGLQDVAFVRSQMAHARLRAGEQARWGRSTCVHAGRSRPAQRSWKPGRSWPRIATAPTRRWPTIACRYAGQPIAACMQPTRAAGRGPGGSRLHVEMEELPAVVDCVAAMRPGSPRVFEMLAGQRLHHQRPSTKAIRPRLARRRSGCAASSG